MKKVIFESNKKENEEKKLAKNPDLVYSSTTT